MCVSFYYFPDSRRSCFSCRIWNSIAYFPDFTVRYRLKKSINVVYKTNIDCSFIRGMVENYCALGNIQPWPTSVNSRPRLNFTSGIIIFHHSPHRGTPLNNPPIEIHANSSMFALIFWPHVTIFCIFWLHECLKWILEFNSKSLFLMPI